MKIIQAMKQVKALTEKAADLRAKISNHSADMDFETPLYADQTKKVSEWVQGHSDVLKEIMRLRVAIQRTNLDTQVSIDLGGKSVTKSIAEWIHRRRDLAGLELQSWQVLTDRNLKEGSIQQSTGVVKEVKIRRYYSPVDRDEKTDLFRSEPHTIDATLEVTNAVTDIIE